jgi:hypothetical protein
MNESTAFVCEHAQLKLVTMMLHCYIVLDSASMTVVHPFHAFMHKSCNTASILTLHQNSQT